MTNNPTYKEAETEDGQKYKYVEIKGYKVIPIETHYIKLQKPPSLFLKEDWLMKLTTHHH